MTKNFLRSPHHPSWHANSADVKQLLGLGRKDKLPKEGMPPRVIQDSFMVWVEPLVGEAKRKNDYNDSRWRRATHRVMARCLVCEKEMSAGRTHQHKCKDDEK